jgi:SAM-dependent methyltransferase
MMLSTITDPGYGAEKRESTNTKAAQKWDAVFDAGAKYRDMNEVFVSRLIEEFLSLSGIKPSHVVDLGCGNGDTLAKFCKQGIGVTGIDFSVAALKKAKILLSSCNCKVFIIEADLENLDSVKIKAPTGTLWLCKLVLAFMNDKAKFLVNVKNKMNTGDILLLMTPILHNNIVYQKEDKPGIAIRFEEVESLIAEIFGNKQVFSNEYHGERGHTISYLAKK